jgi:hypothetical protein
MFNSVVNLILDSENTSAVSAEMCERGVAQPARSAEAHVGLRGVTAALRGGCGDREDYQD